MSEQRQKQKFLKIFSSPFRAMKSRPPPSSSVDQDGESGALSGSAALPSRAPAVESLPVSSRIPAMSIDKSKIVNETHNQRPDQNTAHPHRTPAMFSDIEQLHIGVGNFTMNVNHTHDDPLKSLAFQSLPRSHDAAFSASISLDNLARRRCTNDTRVDIITQIMAWVNENDPAKAPPVYWLTGLAGLGKTTIAYTICELLDKARLPFASFFCSLQLDSRNSKLLVPTLCRDLAELYRSYAASVLPILETDSKVVDAGLRIQIDELLAKPWQTSIGQGRDCGLPTPIVIVDALDECDRGSEFLEELLHAINASQLPGIKFLVTSRVDPKIVSLCKTFPPNAVCKLHEVDTANVQTDIEKYLREALPELKDEPELALLSQRAGGLFIYATTAVRFISPLHTSHSVSEMRSHLQTMLNHGLMASHDDSDERLLVDELYERILGVAFRGAGVRATRLRILHTIVCAQSRIEISVLADLAETDQDTVKRVVESLHAVIFISPKDGCVYWYHASFPNFIFSRARARIRISLSLHGNQRPLEFDAFCEARTHHGFLARRCFSIMHKSLHFNMCNLASSYIFDSEVSGLDASIDQRHSLTLRYASRQWARHLVETLPAEDDTDNLLGGLKDFLDNKLLFWIEAMNLIGAKTECSSILKDAESWLEMGKKWPDLLGQLADAINFSTFFAGSDASRSTPHLYISTLSMWNQDSPTWRKWKDRFGLIPSISLPRVSITIPLLTLRSTSFIKCIALSCDDRIVTGCYEVWDAKTGELLRSLQQADVPYATSIAISPDGNRIVSGSWDSSVWVWDTNTGEQLKELRGHTDDVTSVAFSPDGNRIVSGSRDKSVRVWDTKTGQLLRELQGHTNYVNSVAFSSDGNRIVSGSWDTSVRVWDTETGELLRELQGDTSVSSVAFSPDGNRIISGSDTSLWVWDAKKGELLRELQGHTDYVTSVAFSPDGNRIVSGSRDSSVRVWDTNTGMQLRELQGHTDDVSEVTFSADGNRIVSVSANESVRVWDAKPGKQLGELKGHTDAVTSVAFSPDGNRIMSGSRDKSARVWDAKTGEQLTELQGHSFQVTSVAFSPDGNRIVSGSWDKLMRVWDVRTGEQVRELQGHANYVNSVAFSPDGNQIVSGADDESVRVWNAKTGEQVRELQGHTDHVLSVAFSPDGNRIVSGSRDISVRVWDIKMGKQLRELQGHTEYVTSATFSPDNNRIVSGSADASVRLWDVNTGEQLRELRGHILAITSVAFSPDGNRIISGSRDRSAHVWDTQTGERLRELQGHNHWVTSVAISPDGNRVVSGSFDKSVRVWDVRLGEEPKEYTNIVTSPDSKTVSGSTNNSVRAWANGDLDTSWAMADDGWIHSGGDRLVWVPSTIRNVLLRPHNMLILSRHGSAAISFVECKLGAFWHECYTP